MDFLTIAVLGGIAYYLWSRSKTASMTTAEPLDLSGVSVVDISKALSMARTRRIRAVADLIDGERGMVPSKTSVPLVAVYKTSSDTGTATAVVYDKGTGGKTLAEMVEADLAGKDLVAYIEAGPQIMRASVGRKQGSILGLSDAAYEGAAFTLDDLTFGALLQTLGANSDNFFVVVPS